MTCSKRTFGGILTGSDFEASGAVGGQLSDQGIQGWGLRSKSPSRRHHLRIVTHIDQSETIGVWRDDLQSLVQASEA